LRNYQVFITIENIFWIPIEKSYKPEVLITKLKDKFQFDKTAFQKLTVEVANAEMEDDTNTTAKELY